MNEDRRQILGMLAEGKVNADEAERLIAALERAPSPAGAVAAPGHNRPPKYLRVLVEDQDSKGPVKVNVRVPMQLLRAGVRLASIIPPAAHNQVNAAMRENGVPFDLAKLTPENLEEVIEHLNDLTVDVDQEKTKVRVFCE